MKLDQHLPDARPDPEPSEWWRRAAATMSQVELTYQRLPRPAKATIWLVPLFLAERVGLDVLPLLDLVPWA